MTLAQAQAMSAVLASSCIIPTSSVFLPGLGQWGIDGGYSDFQILKAGGCPLLPVLVIPCAQQGGGRLIMTLTSVPAMRTAGDVAARELPHHLQGCCDKPLPPRTGVRVISASKYKHQH